MKKIIAFLTIGLVLFVSCSKEDDLSVYPDVVNPNTNKQAIGSYKRFVVG